MFDTYKTTLCLDASVYEINEIIDWCILEHGEGGFACATTNKANTYEFGFDSTRALVRFGLTWNKSTIKYRNRIR